MLKKNQAAPEEIARWSGISDPASNQSPICPWDADNGLEQARPEIRHQCRNAAHHNALNCQRSIGIR
jgi:hypothetical protein